MSKKKKLTPAQKAEKKRRKAMYEIIFINGKQKQVRRYQPDDMLNGSPIDDPIYFKQHEMWPELHEWELRKNRELKNPDVLDENGT